MQTVEAIGIRTETILARFGNVHERIHHCENWQQPEQWVGSLLESLEAVIMEKRNQRRCTVPDGFFLNEEYQNIVKVGGPGPKDDPVASHKIVHTFRTIQSMTKPKKWLINRRGIF